MADAPAPDITRDAFLGGRLILEQPAKGHRAGTDAVLLAAAVPRGFAGRVYDAGSGVGAVGLAIAMASPRAQVTLIERDPALAALAARNIEINGRGGRVACRVCDLLSREARQTRLAEPVDLVVTNPPFYRPDRVRASPDPGRRNAHVLAPGATLSAWIDACLDRLAPSGTLILIHAASALPDILAGVGGCSVTVLPVHPRHGQPATRVIVRAIVGSRAPFTMAAPLVLHEGDGFTEMAQRLHQGEAGLAW